MPFVSVIVPMYNVQEFVAECVRSLRAQTYTSFQAVFVDDGSTDDSAQRAREAAAGDDRFVFVSRPNGGLSAARNTGLEAAEGDYVSFLDADDWYAPETLERLHAFAMAGDLDVLDFSARSVYEDASARKMLHEEYDNRISVNGVMSGQELFARYWDLRDYRSSACMHLIRRALLEDAGLRFGEGLLHEDELFTPVLFAHAKRAAFLNEPLYCRRIRVDSIMTRPKSMRNVESLYAIAQKLEDWLADHVDELPTAFADAFARDIVYVRDAAYLSLVQVGEREVEEYLNALDPQARMDFNLNVRYLCDRADERFRDIEESRSYAVGHALLTPPRALKQAIDRMKR